MKPTDYVWLITRLLTMPKKNTDTDKTLWWCGHHKVGISTALWIYIKYGAELCSSTWKSLALLLEDSSSNPTQYNKATLDIQTEKELYWNAS